MRLHSYNPGKTKQPFEFYILCKGLNCGRPMAGACPNCFTCTCDTTEEKEFYYWLCFGLWKAKHFERFLLGSVIPYLRLAEFKKELQYQAQLMDLPAWMATIQKLAAIEQHEALLREQLQLYAKIKVALIRKQVRP